MKSFSDDNIIDIKEDDIKLFKEDIMELKTRDKRLKLTNGDFQRLHHILRIQLQLILQPYLLKLHFLQ